ncbi:hypothetical protein C8R43DRAFT_943031 [Mycena crocata]|nr:hypothetical protein C8R43DRAFT_943031 [Mycena crocata]
MSVPAPRFTLDSAAQTQHFSPTLQQSGNFQAICKSGEIAIGTALSYPSWHVAKTVADLDHTGWSVTLMVGCIQVLINESGGKMIPAWCLTAGAGGIIVPHLETVDEMKAAIAASRFPPIRHQSFPPGAFIRGVTDTTPGGETCCSDSPADININANSVGDLRLEMGMTLAMAGDEPEFVAAVAKATKLSEERDIPLLGIAMEPEMIKKRIDQFRLLTCSIELSTLAFGLIRAVGEAKSTAEEHLTRV